MSGTPEFSRQETPEETADYIGKVGAELINLSRTIRVVAQVARERGVDIPPLPSLKNFQVGGKAEMQLLSFRADLRDAIAAIALTANLNITDEELSRRMLELDLGK